MSKGTLIQYNKEHRAMLKKTLSLFTLLIFTIPVSAETLRLNSGESLEGKIRIMNQFCVP